MINGMNRGTTRAHVVRAALESIAQQDADVLEAMKNDFGAPVTQIFADGGPASNNLLMQLQADLVPCQVNCAALSELSALGSGYMGGIACGVYPSFEEIPQRKQPGRSYVPAMSDEKRNALRSIWKQAVKTVGFR
jgi:glycerol kinase